MQRKALGKGLEALFSSTAEEAGTEVSPGPRIVTVPVNDIVPNRNQPRERFSGEAMEELKRSIAENGVLEPPVVRRSGDVFELIAGERRFRAVKALGNDTIDVIVMEVESDEKALVLSLVENIQRENLNAIEEARACRKIMESMDITQEELAGIVGKSRSAVANTLRLLSLPDEIQGMVKNGELAPGSARTLITVDDSDTQLELARRIAREGLSARKAEALVKKAMAGVPSEVRKPELSPFVHAVREDIQRILGTEVKIKGGEEKGKLEIAYYSRDDLERILQILRGSAFD